MDYPIGDRFIPNDCYIALIDSGKLRLESEITMVYLNKMDQQVAPDIEEAKR